jgi:hypothetical protein
VAPAARLGRFAGHRMSDLHKGARGLASIAKLREERSRRGSRWTMQAGLVAAGAIVVSLIAHTVVEHRDLSEGRRALLAKQAAVEEVFGARWAALRDRIESDIVREGGDYAGDRIEPEARTGAFRTEPGLYLRLRVRDTAPRENLARAAAVARRDALVACLLREPNDAAVRGDADAGAFAEQPWNLGRAYAATRILTADWASEVRSLDEPMRLRVFDEQYEKAVRTEIPVAVDIVTRARFFLLALDEDDGAQVRQGDGGPPIEEELQLVAHQARVALIDLKSDKVLFRLRRLGSARVMQAGERAVSDPETLDAMQRQANNCALGRAVESALWPGGADR